MRAKDMDYRGLKKGMAQNGKRGTVSAMSSVASQAEATKEACHVTCT